MIPNDRAIVTTAPTRLELGPSSSSPCTKLRSIFTSSIGSCLRYASDEYPVPKSSMATRIPQVRSVARISVMRFMFSMTEDSVSSTHSDDAGS